MSKKVLAIYYSQSGQLKEIIDNFKTLGIRVSVFIDPTLKFVEAAATAGADRIELYTEPYATNFKANKVEAIKEYIQAAALAKQLGMGVNAGHDLDLFNLNYLKSEIPSLDEVSIGHALVCDALYYGLENTIQLYLRELAK